MGRSCMDCHSNKTAWPWYSYVAPVSWLVESDVRRGKDRMNLSDWERYDFSHKQNFWPISHLPSRTVRCR
jgi:hypothetical protein